MESALRLPLFNDSVVNRHEDARHSKDDGWRFFWKPPGMTLGFGIPGLVLLIVQAWEPEINAALGGLLGSHDVVVRLGMQLLGAMLLFIAAPLYKPADWTPEQQLALDRDKAYFRSKRGI